MNCVVSIYLSGANYIAAHHDQAFSDCGGRLASKATVIIDRVGAARNLVFHDLSGQEIESICMQHGDSYQLAGPVNMLTKHSVPVCSDCGLCVTLSWRHVRNSVSPDGKYATVNGKRVPLDYLERDLEKETKQALQTRCADHGLEDTGSRQNLCRGLQLCRPTSYERCSSRCSPATTLPKSPLPLAL